MTALTTLFVTAFLAATLLPLASEVPLAFVVREHGDLFWPVAVASAGNILGACTTYALARGFLSHHFARTTPAHPRATAWLTRYGSPALVLSWLPVVGDALVALAGVVRMPFWLFLTWTALGKVARYWVVATLARSI